MSRTSQAERLLSKIYGPYPDHIILRHDFPRQGTQLKLRALQLHFGGDKQITGFDETEYITNPPLNSLLEKNPEVVFFGIIEIEKLDCLSEKGLEYLEADFKENDEKMYLAHCRSGLNIKTAYELRKSDSPRLNVKICGRKLLLAHYLTSKNNPEKLLIYSQSEKMKRIYWVQSLHPITYAASRNFFDRYRLRALIEELVLTDPNRTTIGDRNVDWLIERYLETIRPRDQERRYIVESSMEEVIEAEPRHLRHISHAEIRGYFAAHAEWLLAQQIASKQGANKLLNTRHWIVFCREARKDAIIAKEHYVRWGVAHGCEIEINKQYSLARRLAKFGQTEQFWQTQLKAEQRKKLKPGRKRERVMSRSTSTRPVPYQYDSDFSDFSTPDASDSESDNAFSGMNIPGFLTDVPQISNGQFKWKCTGCFFQIDLLDLSQENMKILPTDISKHILSNSWTINDKCIQEALFQLISHHYQTQHLKPDSVYVIQHKGRKCQGTSHSQTSRKNGVLKIKEEDSYSEKSSLQLRRSTRMHRRPRRHDDDW